MYIQVPDSICPISLVVIHKGIEVVVVQVGSLISAVSVWLGKQIDWAIINHMPWGVASSTDLKIADIIRMSPSKTEITLGCQTMMYCMTGHSLSAGRTDVHRAKEPMVTKIQANVTAGVWEGRMQMLDQDSGC